MQKWKDAINNLGNFPQRQDATLDQLEDLVWVANKLGFYDAVDAIKTLVIKSDKRK